MARSTRSSQLETRTARLKLAPRKKPYSVRIAVGVRLGYRRIETAGRWNVIAADGKGGNWMKAFATADDYEEANGDSVLDFWQTQERARVLARNGRDGDATSGDPNKPTTVGEALDTYQADLKTRGGDVSSVARVRKHLPPALSGKLVALLNMRELRDWRDRLGEKVSAGSVNCASITGPARCRLPASIASGAGARPDHSISGPDASARSVGRVA